MPSGRRFSWPLRLSMALCLAAAVFCAWAWRARAEQTARRQTLAGQATTAAGYIGDLRRLKTGARRAVEPTAESRNPATFFEQLADRCGIARDRLRGVETRAIPGAAGSPYEETATVVRLAGVEQAALGQFARSIEKDNPQYLIKEMRLTASDKGPALWDATVTVSLLVYKPGQTEGM